ncbi:C1 family peptidase [Undibacterium sp. TJN19]|uniref:C1 family peptidase n=1 Tax=Undibacterium sp. TJN19 TaxID=3413055 RepID=UPI003BEFB589
MPSKHIQFNGSALALDARPDRLDIRDRLYTPRVCNLPPCYPDPKTIKTEISKYIRAGMVLDQGSEGACTGFGLAAVINYLFWRRDPASLQTSPRMLFHLAKFYDEWAGEDYNGSSCRGALKGWHKHGVCSRALWPYTVNSKGHAPAFEAPKPGWAQDAVTRPVGTYYRVDKASVTDLQAAILEIGAVYASCKAHQGWALDADTDSKPKSKAASKSFTSFDQLPVIPWSSETTGGHAFALIGYTDQGFVVQNSWGKDWGFHGFAVLTYADWVANASDAWTVSLGVPVRQTAVIQNPAAAQDKAQPSALANLSSGPAFKANGSLLSAPSITASNKTGPDSLSLDQSYGLTVVMGNDGGLIQRIVAVADAAATVDQVVLQSPQAWLKKQGNKKVLKLALYAHGGLNTEGDSLKRVAALAPYFLANGIYPVFITWKTGLNETLIDILKNKLQDYLPGTDLSGDFFAQLKNAALDAMDRTVESLAESLGGKGQWVQMKQNALQGAEDGDPPRGLFAIAERLQQLSKALGKDKLEIHLIGHSAGSIVQGYLLNLLAARQLPVQTCTLYAPACTVAFAETTYRKVIETGILAAPNFHIHMMSNARELDDNVAKIYNKSLLYLVARAFETQHKTPLLGMAASFDAAYFASNKIYDDQWNQASIATLKSWNAFYWGNTLPSGFAETGEGLSKTQAANLHIINAKDVSCGTRTIPVAHGSFDNDVAVVSATLARILGLDTSDQLTMPVSNLDY